MRRGEVVKLADRRSKALVNSDRRNTGFYKLITKNYKHEQRNQSKND